MHIGEVGSGTLVKLQNSGHSNHVAGGEKLEYALCNLIIAGVSQTNWVGCVGSHVTIYDGRNTLENGGRIINPRTFITAKGKQLIFDQSPAHIGAKLFGIERLVEVVIACQNLSGIKLGIAAIRPAKCADR